MKKLIKIVLILLVAALAVGAAGVVYLSRGLEAVGQTQVLAVSPSSLSDGVYEGSYDLGRWSNRVAVTVQGGRITGIALVKDVDIVSEGLSGEIFNRVIRAQNTTVDTVSDATVTSKAYLKSIENALTK